MTKKKIARTKRSTKRAAAEKPVDAEIRRAAGRAGIKEVAPMVPVTKEEVELLARTLTAEVVDQHRAKATPRAMALLLLAMSESTAKAADGFRRPFEVEREKESREEYLAALSDLVCGGLHVEDTPSSSGMLPEQAIIRGAAAQLKAIILALHPSDAGEAWAMHDDEMSQEDLHVALCGVASTLRNSKTVLYRLRDRGEFRGAFERNGEFEDEAEGDEAVDEAVDEPLVQAAAGGAP